MKPAEGKPVDTRNAMGIHAAGSMADGSNPESSITISTSKSTDLVGCELRETPISRCLSSGTGHRGQVLVSASPEIHTGLPTIDRDASGEKVDVAVLSAERLHRLSLQDASSNQSECTGQPRPDTDKSWGPQQEREGIRHRSVSPSPSVASSHCSTVSQAAFSNPRQRFLLFVKILFKCLSQANEPEVLKKAKKIVAECTKRNRQGDPKFSPLMEAVEKRLRGFVGEVHWRRSLLLLRHYLTKKNDSIPDEIESR